MRSLFILLLFFYSCTDLERDKKINSDFSISKTVSETYNIYFNPVLSNGSLVLQNEDWVQKWQDGIGGFGGTIITNFELNIYDKIFHIILVSEFWAGASSVGHNTLLFIKKEYGNAKLIQTVRLARNSRISKITSSNQIQIDYILHGPNDPNCCPTLKKNAVFGITPKGLKFVSINFQK